MMTRVSYVLSRHFASRRERRRSRKFIDTNTDVIATSALYLLPNVIIRADNASLDGCDARARDARIASETPTRPIETRGGSGPPTPPAILATHVIDVVSSSLTERAQRIVTRVTVPRHYGSSYANEHPRAFAPSERRELQ